MNTQNFLKKNGGFLRISKGWLKNENHRSTQIRGPNFRNLVPVFFSGRVRKWINFSHTTFIDAPAYILTRNPKFRRVTKFRGKITEIRGWTFFPKRERGPPPRKKNSFSTNQKEGKGFFLPINTRECRAFLCFVFNVRMKSGGAAFLAKCIIVSGQTKSTEQPSGRYCQREGVLSGTRDTSTQALWPRFL